MKIVSFLISFLIIQSLAFAKMSFLPDVDLQDTEGNTISIHKLISKKPSILIFYRGGWCPYCNAHLSAIQDIENQILESGYQIIAISPDKPSKVNETILSNDLKYTLLSDSKMLLADKLGIGFTVEPSLVSKYKNEYKIDIESASGELHHRLPHPSVFIVNTNAAIQYSYINKNYKERLDSSVILTEMKKTMNPTDWKLQYASLLKKYVRDKGIDYKSWFKNKGDIEKIRQVAKSIGEIDTKNYARNQKISHFINAYNAWMISLVLDHYPIQSVKEIGEKPFDVFKKDLAIINGEAVSLDYIEKTILLKDLREPLIHFAVNCASESCPPLLDKLYDGELLEKQLEAATRSFLNSRNGVIVDREAKIIYLSSLFNWYEADFEKYGGIRKFINRYRDGTLPIKYTIRYLDYNWSLNKS